MLTNIVDQINRGAEKGNKFYSHDEAHDRRRPADLWFQESVEGLVLFVVFYTQACRWSRCLGCNLPSKMSKEHVDYKAIIAQIDHVFSDPRVVEKREQIRKVIISNNGSVLDEETFSSTALMYLMAMINLTLPNLSVLTLETRPEYVDSHELEFLSRALAEGDTPTTLELAIGFEAYDETIRNDIFFKGLSFEVFEGLARSIAPYDFSLKCYLMLKPVPAMTDEQGVEDVKRAIDYLAEAAEKNNIDINIHLNPTYAALGTELEKSFSAGKYEPPKLEHVVEAVKHAEGKKISIFIGLSDEGLAVEGGSFIRPGDEKILEKLNLFNKTNDYSLL